MCVCVWLGNPSGHKACYFGIGFSESRSLIDSTPTFTPYYENRNRNRNRIKN